MSFLKERRNFLWSIIASRLDLSYLVDTGMTVLVLPLYR